MDNNKEFENNPKESAPYSTSKAENTSPEENTAVKNLSSDENVGSEPKADFSEYHSEIPSYASAPESKKKETVYVSTQPKEVKRPRARLSLGAAALLVAVCIVFSGSAAFGGTILANKLLGSNITGTTGNRYAGTPSIVLQSYQNENKTPGTYDQVAEAVSPTVVEITTESIVTDSIFWGGSYVTSGAGSGVIISADGTIITNNHVVSGASTVTVRLTDGTEYAATVLGRDSDSDIAVIKISAENLPFVLIGNSDSLKVGEEVIAVGNPLGELGGTVTNGIVSALSRDVSIDGTEMTLIQTNAALNPGNSGGGLFNMYGELVGIVNAKSSTTASGTSVEGIGFAIPSNTAIKVATELTNYGYVRGRVMLGISYIDIDSSYKAMYYRVSALGVYVADSPYNDQLKAGDRIVAVDGSEVTYGADVKAAIKDRSVGDEISLTVVRDGKYVDVKATLREYVPTTAASDSSEFEDNFEGGNEETAPADGFGEFGEDAEVYVSPFGGFDSFEDFFFDW